VAWGDDSTGEVSHAPTGTGYTALAAGGFTAIALTSSGSVVAWGDDSQKVVSTIPLGNTFTAVAVGIYNGYALTTVESLRQQKINVGNALQALLPSGSTNQDVDQDINKAVADIAQSTSLSLWLSGDQLEIYHHNHLDPGQGGKVFDLEKDAVNQLTDLVKDKGTPDAVISTAFTAIDRLVGIDIELAKIQLQDSTETGGDSKKLSQAINSIARATNDDQAGKPSKAIDDAKQAWQFAVQALQPH
jgi:hypothetical protein